MSAVLDELQRARKELLDLSLRNNLINYRTLKSKGLEVVDEKPDQVFETLVTRERGMSFLPAPEEWTEAETQAATDEQDLLFERLLEELAQDDSRDALAERHTDTRLQTPYSKARLERRLLNTFHAARSSIEEQGVNTLYLAIGMLEWYESPSSDIRRKAPLLLVPVQLTRTDVRGRFKLRWTGSDVGHNLSIEAKLKQEFGLQIPGVVDNEEIVPTEYFSSIGDLIRTDDRWMVDRSSIVLGFFSFAKFLMYLDLDPQTWPEDSKPQNHEVLAAVLQEGFHAEPSGEEFDLDRELDPADIFQIRDADSSQTLAIQDVHSGTNLVIQGPPGTGNSQTISNLIAEAIVRGRRVLFVAEKMAALEVVKRRLDHDEIGVACLELHSNKTNKKEFLEDLDRTSSLTEPIVRRDIHDLHTLKRHRDTLNTYCEAVNGPLGDSGLTPQQVFGLLATTQRELAGRDLPDLQIDNLAELTREHAASKEAMLGQLSELLSETGALTSHSFWGSEIKVVVPSTKSRIAKSAQAACSATEALLDGAAEVADRLGLRAPQSIEAASLLVQALQLLEERPSQGALRLGSSVWQSNPGLIGELLDLGERKAKILAQHDGLLLSEAWSANVLQTRRSYLDVADKWWRFLSTRHRRARSHLASLCVSDPPTSKTGGVALCDAILEKRDLDEALDNETSLLAELFGDDWRGERTDWPALVPAARWCLNATEALAKGTLPDGFVEAADAPPVKPDELATLRSRVESLREKAQDTCRLAAEAAELAIEEVAAWQREELVDLTQRLSMWQHETEAIQEMARYNYLAAELEREGLGPVIGAVLEQPSIANVLGLLFRYAWLGALAEWALHSHPALGTFDVATHEDLAERYRELDQSLLRANRGAVAHSHWESLPPRSGIGQMGVLLKEFQKKRRHLAIRQVIERAGKAVQAIKPVFMMSPLSVAAYLPAGSIKFDLVVFDEASQVRPVDALGAILRGGQAVVVGDSKQLPPTSFFDSLMAESDEDSEAADMESILGLFVARGAPERMLRWHYRSRHEDLITVSNHEFYDHKLVTFPSPSTSSPALGVVFNHLPDTSYDRGKTATNQGEARAVADAVMKHARECPEQSLGVAAFSQKQAQAILDEVEIARRRDPTLETFFQSHPEETFFIKNLENVQGDERDVIFVSVGYGKTSEGYLPHSFGPLNRDGGERRLNVLITRARSRCEVFCNFTSEDIDLSRSRQRGVVALKSYLQFAQTGVIEVPTPVGDAESPLESDVGQAVRSLGYEVEHQVGTSGFRIDLAVRDPKTPGRYLLGVECDGATYHSARWARDRDRLRQAVLENLGWTIYRIWSTDWFRSPDRELARLKQVIERAQIDPMPPNRPAPTSDSSVERAQAPLKLEEQASLKCPRYKKANLVGMARELAGGPELHRVSSYLMADWVATVVRTESPVHLNEVARRITEGANLKRTGKRIRAAVGSGVQIALQRGWIKQTGDFLWSPDESHATSRDRSAFSPQDKKIEWVAPEELDAAIRFVLQASHGADREEVLREAGRILGFSRTTANIASRINERVTSLLDREEIRAVGTALSI